MFSEKARESSGENDFNYNFKVENDIVPLYFFFNDVKLL